MNNQTHKPEKINLPRICKTSYWKLLGLVRPPNTTSKQEKKTRNYLGTLEPDWTLIKVGGLGEGKGY